MGLESSRIASQCWMVLDRGRKELGTKKITRERESITPMHASKARNRVSMC